MSVSYLIAGIVVLLVLSAESGEEYALFQSTAETDQSQNEDNGMENGEENDNSEVNNGFEEEDEGGEEKLNDVDESDPKIVQYHDADDRSDEEGEDVEVKVGGHPGPGGHGIYADKMNDDNDDDDDKEDHDMYRDDDEDNDERTTVGIWAGPEPFEEKEDDGDGDDDDDND
ncbi:hypothetical protein SprV_0702394500 [Sparganum proliferum]